MRSATIAPPTSCQNTETVWPGTNCSLGRMSAFGFNTVLGVTRTVVCVPSQPVMVQVSPLLAAMTPLNRPVGAPCAAAAGAVAAPDVVGCAPDDVGVVVDGLAEVLVVDDVVVVGAVVFVVLVVVVVGLIVVGITGLATGAARTLVEDVTVRLDLAPENVRPAAVPVATGCPSSDPLVNAYPPTAATTRNPAAAETTTTSLRLRNGVFSRSKGTYHPVGLLALFSLLTSFSRFTAGSRRKITHGC